MRKSLVLLIISFVLGLVIWNSHITSAASFSDIRSGSQLDDYIQYLSEKNIISGYPDGSFRPENNINRAEALKIILLSYNTEESLKIENLKIENLPFPDLHISQWFTPYIYKAKKLGITSGYPDGFFRPNNTVNRAEFIKMAISTLPDFQNNIAASIELKFKDIDPQQWYFPYLNFGTQKLIIANQKNFSPTTPMTRQDAVEIIYALSKRHEKQNFWQNIDLNNIPSEHFTLLNEDNEDEEEDKNSDQLVANANLVVSQKTVFGSASIFRFEGINLHLAASIFIERCENLRDITPVGDQETGNIIEIICTPEKYLSSLNNPEELYYELRYAESTIPITQGSIKVYQDEEIKLIKITPSQPIYNQEVTFQVTGNKIPSQIEINSDYCLDIELHEDSLTDYSFEFSCIPDLTLQTDLKSYLPIKDRITDSLDKQRQEAMQRIAAGDSFIQFLESPTKKVDTEDLEEMKAWFDTHPINIDFQLTENNQTEEQSTDTHDFSFEIFPVTILFAELYEVPSDNDEEIKIIPLGPQRYKVKLLGPYPYFADVSILQCITEPLRNSSSHTYTCNIDDSDQLDVYVRSIFDDIIEVRSFDITQIYSHQFIHLPDTGPDHFLLELNGVNLPLTDLSIGQKFCDSELISDLKTPTLHEYICQMKTEFTAGDTFLMTIRNKEGKKLYKKITNKDK